MVSTYGATPGRRSRHSEHFHSTTFDTAQRQGFSYIFLLNFHFDSRTECYDYLFAIACEMRKCGFDPNEAPNAADDYESTGGNKHWGWERPSIIILWNPNTRPVQLNRGTFRFRERRTWKKTPAGYSGTVRTPHHSQFLYRVEKKTPSPPKLNTTTVRFDSIAHLFNAKGLLFIDLGHTN